MTKILATCAAVALTAAFALPAPATAAEKRADGVRNQDQIEVSSQRRYRRYGYRYGPRYGYLPAVSFVLQRSVLRLCAAVLSAVLRPRVGVGVGPFGFGFGSSVT